MTAHAPRWEDPGPQAISGILSLAGSDVPPEVISTWTQEERETAVSWASAEHLSASGNTGIARVRKPDLVTRAEEICSSPAMAQLAVEAWASRPSVSDFMMNPAAIARMAGDALAGIIVLTRRGAGW